MNEAKRMKAVLQRWPVSLLLMMASCVHAQDVQDVQRARGASRMQSLHEAQVAPRGQASRWALHVQDARDASLPQSRGAESVQDVSLPQSLAEAIDRALVDRWDVRLSQTEIQQARSKEKQARARFRPTLGLSVEFSNTRSWDDYAGFSADYFVPGIGMVPVDIASDSARYQLLPRLEANYGLYSGGGDRAALRQASALALSAGVGRQIAMRKAAFDVALRYLDLRRSCAHWHGAQAELALAEDRLKLSERRYGDGRLAEIEIRSARLERIEKAQQREQRVLQVHSAYARYAAAITNQPAEAADVEHACRFRASLQEDLKALRGNEGAGPDHGRLSGGPAFRPEQESVAAHPSLELEKQRLEIEAARHRIQIEKAAQRPQLSLFAHYGFVGRKEHGMNDLLRDTRRQEAVLGFRLSYRLYDGQLGRAKVDEAQHELQRRHLVREQHAARLEQYRHRNLNRQREAGQTLELARARYELALSRSALAEKRFRSGRESALARAESRMKVQQARDAVTMAELDSARLQLEALFVDAALQEE
ncbi:MAG: TolC family protein [Lautropia sp.]|nr:TolC family protein [Lautropia sp.]